MSEIKHYGTPRHSGRYPWGSGEDPQRSSSFLQKAAELRKQGLSEREIARDLGVLDKKGNPSTSALRAKKSIAKDAKRAADTAEALRLKNKGCSNVEIGRRMGINESSVRALLNPALQERADTTRVIANMLKDSVEKKNYIDVGAGVERHIGISRTKLQTSIAMLKEEGYTVHYIPVEQLGTGKKTTVMVLAKPGTTYSEVSKNRDKIKLVTDYSEDGGRTVLGLEPPRNVDASRVRVRYTEDGGSNKDGIIELRRGVSDISLGNSKYAQVRIAVNGTHYLKGMAMYSDNLPKGVDILFNTNKDKSVPMLGTKDNTVLKPLKKNQDGDIDFDNPFGATVRQQHFITDEGLKNPKSSEMLTLKRNGISYQDIARKFNITEDDVKRCISVKAINIVNEEGEWRDKWSKNLSSQMLSKQSSGLAKKQLALAYDAKKEEYDEIMSLTNPTVKKKLLDDFADGCDSAAVHLKAAAIPRSSWHVLLPIPEMKETEIYAPNYRDGENVVLIRYPHSGAFEIPELVVNNRHQVAKNTLGDAKDAVGIHPSVAAKLSGADFDGDAVLVIPNGDKSVKTAASLKGLSDFNPQEMYKAYDGMPRVGPATGFYKQRQMGSVSNLITDMTIRGTNLQSDEIARAVRHSMVIIDAEKHNLNYKQSYIDNGIAELKRKYQGSPTSGAATLISKASSEARPDHRVEGQRVVDKNGKVRRLYVDPNTGRKLYEKTGETYITKSGRTVKKTTPSTKMYETDDAFTLSSGTPMETIYALHANKLKALANNSRKEMVNIRPLTQSKSAKITYAPEVARLNAALNVALKNAPLERQAQLAANKIVSMKRESNPDLDAADIKKIKGQALTEARNRVGAGKQRIVISDREWEAIQAGAVSNNTLSQILNNTDIDRVKELATPRVTKTMTASKISRAKAMLESGYTQAEVADQLGVTTSVLAKSIE